MLGTFEDCPSGKMHLTSTFLHLYFWSSRENGTRHLKQRFLNCTEEEALMKHEEKRRKREAVKSWKTWLRASHRIKNNWTESHKKEQTESRSRKNREYEVMNHALWHLIVTLRRDVNCRLLAPHLMNRFSQCVTMRCQKGVITVFESGTLRQCLIFLEEKWAANSALQSHTH